MQMRIILMIHFNQYNISQTFQHGNNKSSKQCVFYNHNNFILNFEFHVPDDTFVASTPLYTVRIFLSVHSFIVTLTFFIFLLSLLL